MIIQIGFYEYILGSFCNQLYKDVVNGSKKNKSSGKVYIIMVIYTEWLLNYIILESSPVHCVISTYIEMNVTLQPS